MFLNNVAYLMLSGQMEELGQSLQGQKCLQKEGATHFDTIPYNFATLDIIVTLVMTYPLLQVKVQKATEMIVQRFRRQILALEAMHLGKKKK